MNAKITQLFTLAIACIVSLVSVAPVFAVSVPPTRGENEHQSSESAMKQVNKIDRLKSLANKELARRIDALQKIITKINEVKRLTPAQKASLVSQVRTEIASLTALQTKIQGDTDLVTLQADTQSVIKDYRVFALFIPEIYLITSANRVLDIADNMSSVAGKLQARITEDKAKGDDVTKLQTLLTDMNAKIADGKTQANNAINLVLPLTPAGFPANKTVLESARKLVQTAHQDLMDAFHDGQQIFQGLHTLQKPTEASGSAEKSASPSVKVAPHLFTPKK